MAITTPASVCSENLLGELLFGEVHLELSVGIVVVLTRSVIPLFLMRLATIVEDP